MTQAYTNFGIYEQDAHFSPSVDISSTGQKAGTRAHFSYPIEIHKIVLMAAADSPIGLDVGTKIRWQVVNRIGGTGGVIRNTDHLEIVVAVPTATIAGHFVNLARRASGGVDVGGAVRVDPGEEAICEVVTAAGALQTARMGFLYRAFPWGGDMPPLDSYGNAPAFDRLINMNTLPASQVTFE